MMDVKGKTKDNMKTIMNIPLFFYYKNMELVYNWLMVVKPKASFVLDKNVQLLVYQSLKSLLFYDEYASNISRLVNLEDEKLYEMKSQDCHVFMQTLISLTYRDLLLKKIYDALMKINHFFRDICSNKLHSQYCSYNL
jgi:hypothetical protein